ncbi:DUF6882 domain-containing protein [Corynebacterium tapiri]|uniref:Uncharacterized protein n=1 Tax=Corynebacterium tapiri TaxID=1448266 RepID=A0A5C4U7K5_9CORY|nr:DUF6882 domain-containing protein [Corynebacterium tapiri]TNM00453.1 hypothetical protein FHE74_00435 [Corynebacterium tapiri]
MDLSPPATLADVIADGLIEQAGYDLTFPPATKTEIVALAADPHMLDAPAVLRIFPGNRKFNATRIARIVRGEWEWLASRTETVNIPQFLGPQVPSEELLYAARTLYANAPVVLVPCSAEEMLVFVLDAHGGQPPLKDALLTGLPRIEAGFARRALRATAAFRGLGIHEDAYAVEFSSGDRVELENDLPVSLGPSQHRFADMRSDGSYLAAEHQLLFDGVFPRPDVHVDAQQARARLTPAHGSPVLAGAQIVAVISGSTWQWAWAHPQLAPHPCAQVAHALRQFGQAYGIIPLLTPRMPAQRAHDIGLLTALKPVAGLYAHGIAPLGADNAVTLLQHPALILPPPTEAAIVATLKSSVDSGVDTQRAIATYARARGITTHGTHLVAPDTGRLIEVTPGQGGPSVRVLDTH